MSRDTTESATESKSSNASTAVLFALAVVTAVMASKGKGEDWRCQWNERAVTAGHCNATSAARLVAYNGEMLLRHRCLYCNGHRSPQSAQLPNAPGKIFISARCLRSSKPFDFSSSCWRIYTLDMCAFCLVGALGSFQWIFSTVVCSSGSSQHVQ